MKKSLLALAALSAVAGAASAQTSVTIYGSFDGGVRNVTNTTAAGQSRFTMGSNGTFNSNRIGFRGVEDLGGGMNAHFVLETGFNTGTGSLDTAPVVTSTSTTTGTTTTTTSVSTPAVIFSRQAFVGLGGNWGTLDLGRQYTVAFKVVAAYDPFQYKYTGIIPAVAATAGVRYNNDIQYSYTTSFGLVARAGYAVGEVAGSTASGSTATTVIPTVVAKVVGASYNNGPLSLGGAYTQRNIGIQGSATGANFDNNHYTVGGAYKFGNLKGYVAYADERQATASGIDTETKYSWVGASYLFTPQLEATYAYYRIDLTAATVPTSGKKDLNVLGATYAFSKRTNFYANLDVAKLSGALRIGPATATPQTDQTGVSIGINHTF